MSEDLKDSKKKPDLFDPEKKIADETSDSIQKTGWLQDEQWSIQIDNNRRILLAGGMFEADTNSVLIAGSAACACKSCAASSSSGDVS